VCAVRLKPDTKYIGHVRLKPDTTYVTYVSGLPNVQLYLSPATPYGAASRAACRRS
jgi:hypothetical protein